MNMMAEYDESSFSTDDFIEEIVESLQAEDWDRTMNKLLTEARVRLTLPESFRRLGGIAMGTACYKDSVPLKFYQTVVEVTGPDAAAYQDAGLRTPLHMVLMYLDRPDIVRFLVDMAPSTLDMHDHVGLRPIDILTQKILMKEERLRYLNKAKHQPSNPVTTQHIRGSDSQRESQLLVEGKLLNDCWECARLLCLAHSGQLQSNPSLPLLHACCLDHQHIPFSLLQRAMRKHPFQLRLGEPENGNTPLHIIASRFVAPGAAASVEVDEEDDLFGEIFRAYPQSAGILNQHGEYPLDLAILAGRKWNSGCRSLVQVHPPAMLHQIQRNRGKRFLYQLLTLVQEEFVSNMVFQLMRAKVEIVLE